MEATVAGCTTLLIVDTGATSHVLTRDLAERAGLRLDAAAPGRDSAGGSVPSWSVGDVDVEIDGSSFDLSEVVAIDGPEPFREWGVGGFLSPQLLAPSATVLLDLAHNRVDVFGHELPIDEATEARGFPPCVLLKGTHHVAGTIGVEIRIPPAAPVVAIFDTGAAETEIAMSALATTVEGETFVTGKGIGGSEVEAAVLRAQHFLVGTTRVHVPALGVRHEIPAPEDAAGGEIPLAMIGMDVLRGSGLVIEPRGSGSVWWLFPAGEQ